MEGRAKYLRKLADRYELVAATMRTDKDREAVETIAAEYRRLADDAEQKERRMRGVAEHQHWA
jgi:hypothetical protein